MAKKPPQHYATLGVKSSATADEIRRAYRVLARRYHPDTNPGKNTEDRFKTIAEAYRVLSDPIRRRQYDLEVDLSGAGVQGSGTYRSTGRPSATERFHHARFEQFGSNAKIQPEGPAEETPSARDYIFKKKVSIWSALTRFVQGMLKRESKSSAHTTAASEAPGDTNRARPAMRSVSRDGVSAPADAVSKVSIIEVSLSVHDAIFGVKKTVEVAEPEGMRKISVRLPPGVRNGSIVRLRAKNTPGEELVLITRVASHPFLRIESKGLVFEVPITVNEAVSGASISVPTLDEPVVIKIPAGAQSGHELRVKGKGIADREGERGDLFVRLMIRVPECSEAYGIRERATELDKYFEKGVRNGLPHSLASS